jgi:hypothetical protein
MKNAYEIRGNETVIFIPYKGKIVETIIDTDDLEKVSQIRGTWFCYASRGKIYIATSIMISGKSNKVSIHRIVSNAKINDITDHINRDTLDNRKCNLRIVNVKENSQNKSISTLSSSGERGVSWHKKQKKWIARVSIERKRIQIGSFDTKEEASIAAKNARLKLLPYSYEGESKIPEKSIEFDNKKRLFASNTSGYRNVAWSKNNKKWAVYRTINGKRNHFGYFEDLDTAIKKSEEIRSTLK